MCRSVFRLDFRPTRVAGAHQRAEELWYKALAGSVRACCSLEKDLSAVVDEIAHSMEAFPAFGLLLLPEDLLVGRCSEKAIPTLTMALVQPSTIEKGTFEK